MLELVLALEVLALEVLVELALGLELLFALGVLALVVLEFALGLELALALEVLALEPELLVLALEVLVFEVLEFGLGVLLCEYVP